MLQGLAKQLRGVVGKTVPGIPVTAGSQFIPPPLGSAPEKFRLPTAIEPPAGLFLASIMAPVGIVARPNEVLSARNDSPLRVSYIRVGPPPTTVRLLTPTTQ